MRFISTFVLFLCLASTITLGAFEFGEAVATREEIALWLKDGSKIGATHMIVVCDRFDYSDFPDYVYPGQDVQQKVYEWNCQDLFMVMEVYKIH